jgi:hypothetical protein
MADPPTEPAAIMTRAEARRRFAMYFGIRLMGLALLLMGVFMLTREVRPMGIICVAAGALSLLIRPKNLGLTRPPEA